MNSALGSREKYALLALLTAALFAAWLFNRVGGLSFLVVGMLVLIAALQLEVYSRISRSMIEIRETEYSQIEALFSISQVIRLNAPLPPMRGWAASPDFLLLMIKILRERRPKLTVELGSGVSSLIAGYVVQEWGGRVLSVEHSEDFAKLSRGEIKKHGLGESVTICWAPLKDISLGGRNYLWYDLTKIDNKIGVEVLIVDGPPGNLQKLSRYPALPLLRDRLIRDSLILMDDADREDERKILKLWLSEANGAECDLVATEKGAAVLRWTGDCDQKILRRAAGSN